MSKTALLIHRGQDGMRGTEICLIQTARAFTARGWRVFVCRNHPVMDAELASLSSPSPKLLPIDFPELRLEWYDSLPPVTAYFRALRHLRQLVRDMRPDIIYCSGGLPCQLAVPVARLARVPVMCHFHHPAIKRDYYLWMVKFADKVIFPSQFTRSHSLKKARVDGEVIYNGIDIARFRPALSRDPSWRQRLGIAADAIVIGQVAALIDHKRPEMLVRAFARLSRRIETPLHLCMVGKGERLNTLQAMARELDIEARVTIVGNVPDVLPFYQHVFDINVLVSRQEGLGLAAIEGSACGLPALVTDCTGLAETVVPQKTGFHFGLDDEKELDARLLELVRDPALRMRMGAAGRQHTEQTFSAQTYNERIVAATERLMR